MEQCTIDQLYISIIFLDLAWFSSVSSKRLCIFGVHSAMYV